MTIRKKTLIAICIPFLSLFIILYITSQFILLKGFANLEEEKLTDKIKQTVNIITHDISTIDGSTLDWAAWDDTYNFIKNRNRRYIDANVIEETFPHLNINLMVFMDVSGQIVFSKGFDLHTKETIPVPQSLIKLLSPQNLLLRHTNKGSSVTGIVLLPECPVLIASRPILTSKVEGPIRGTLIMGRYLDFLEIEHLEKLMRVPITVLRFNDKQLPPDFQTARALLSEEALFVAQPINNDFFGGYALLHDIYGNPALLLKVKTTRTIYHQGKIIISYFAILFLITTVVFVIIIMVLLEKQVLSPLLYLGKSVNKITETGDLTKRVPIIGTDEFSLLSGQINQMLNALEQAEKQRHKLEAQIQRAQKMEALGNMAGGVAHDLNNILGGLVGYPQLLLMQIPGDSPLRKAILTIQQSGEKAAEIVLDLLTLARRGVSISVVVNLNDIISDYLRSLEYEKLKTFHPNVHLQTNLKTDLLNILGSPIHLYKTVMNLVSNAAEAMPDGGEIHITTENLYLDRPIMGYDVTQTGDYVVLAVSDNGIGISLEDKEKIFEPFYTKKIMGRSGTGLGMAVVWGTVIDHNGHIDIHTTEGNGTKFTLFFPVTRQELLRDNTPLRLEEYGGKGESILIVDDVKEQREIASSMLIKLGYAVKSVASGEEAVDYLKNNSADLLMLDMIMDPGIDGLETYKRILQLHPRQKAIIVSGFSETEQVKEAQKLGAEQYVKKPYLLEKIGRAVRCALDK